MTWRLGPPPPPPADAVPDWQQAKPASIARSLAYATSLPTGGWFALDASRRIGKRPRNFWAANTELVAWRDAAGLHAAPAACPHMGASLEGAACGDGALLCPWHGLTLPPNGHGKWQHLPSLDDGVLFWAQLPVKGEDPTDAPMLPPRPAHYLDGVVRIQIACDPAHVIANRLDPWHGAHFHPYSFGALEVLEDTPECLTIRVEKRIVGRLRVEVDAAFHCPDARTIVMTILRGEGAGSVVETHATPTRPGRTAVIEATLATSERKGFVHARKVNSLIRPFIERSAKRLWVDDAAYAERLAQLEQG